MDEKSTIRMNFCKPQIINDIETNNCFDFLRFFFAFAVFCAHYDILRGEEFVQFPIYAPQAVDAFFVISGILIHRSYCRSTSLRSYFQKRARRILPAYVLIVLLSAVLFSAFSSLSLRDYFTSSELGKYLLANLTTMNFLHPSLPGVLSGEAVNPSLWTIKLELLLYLAVPFAVWLYACSSRCWSLVLVSLVSLSAVLFGKTADETGVASYDLAWKWTSLSSYFMAGGVAYFYREELRRYKWYMILPAILVLMADGYFVDFFRPFAVTVIVYFAAFTLPFLNRFGKIGDLSYGIYIFHAPIINFTRCLGWEGGAVTFAVTLFLVLLCAFLSWHLMEKKILAR